VSPAALGGFPLASCEIGRLRSPSVCGSEALARRVAKLIDKRTGKALALLGRAERAGLRKKRKLLRGTTQQLAPIPRKAGQRHGVSAGCKSTLAALVATARQAVDGLRAP
jgi:hypothetical protein